MKYACDMFQMSMPCDTSDFEKSTAKYIVKEQTVKIST